MMDTRWVLFICEMIGRERSSAKTTTTTTHDNEDRSLGRHKTSNTFVYSLLACFPFVNLCCVQPLRKRPPLFAANQKVPHAPTLRRKSKRREAVNRRWTAQ